MGELFVWHHMQAPEVLRALASRQTGLSAREASDARAKYGPNILGKEIQTKTLRLFFRQFSSPLLLVLFFAGVLSALLAHWADVGLIAAIIAFNVVLGFFQEYKAEKALQELRAMLPAVTRVRRDGKTLEVLSAEIVPGDICIFLSGDKITADGRIISASSFFTNEAALTGESAEVAKSAEGVAADLAIAERSSMVFAGTIATLGKAEVIITATGEHTAFGKIADMVSGTAEEETPLQKELRRFSKKLAVLMSGIALAVFLFGLAKGLPPVMMLAVAAALAVAAVPEGLLMSLTVILAVGMRRMLKRKALVRRMVAAETLGSVSVMCVDKTGTLTTGSMSVVEVQGVAGDRDVQSVKEALAKLVQDGARLSLTEKAVAAFLKGSLPADASGYLDELLFDSKRKYSAKLWQEGSEEVLYVWGAPEVLLTKSGATDVRMHACQKILDDMTSRGLRVLFIGMKRGTFGSSVSVEDVTDIEPLGFIGLEDPLRPHAAETVADALRAGVRTVMVTGDHPATAARIASLLGLRTDNRSVMTGTELAELTDEELQDRIEIVPVFARVLPEQKVRIVLALRANGHVVAMTGDGVNDAPALRAADIGVAMGNGTDVARETADMVILDNDVASIVAAIREGRVIFDNLRKVILFLLTFSLGEVAIISAAILLGFPLPFSPLHILWINLVTDGLPAMALAFEPEDSFLMREPPRSPSEMIVSPVLRRLMFVIGGITVLSLMVSQAVLFTLNVPLESARTFLFFSLGLDTLFALFVIRNLRESVFTMRHGRNPLLLLSFLLSLVLLVLPVFEPYLRSVFALAVPSVIELRALAILTIGKFLLFELAKVLVLGKKKKNPVFSGISE
jgi:Ca2+-transporting ATPase